MLRRGGMTTISKKELVDRIAGRIKQTQTVTRNVIQLFLDEIVHELSLGNRIEFRDFGVFEVQSRAARPGWNPKTLEKIDVPPRQVVKFTVGRGLKALVSGTRDD